MFWPGLFKAIKNAFEKEKVNLSAYDMPLKRRLQLYKQGYLSDREVVYDLSNYELSDYLSDVEFSKTASIGQPYNVIFDDKLMYHLILKPSYPDCIPNLVATISPGGDMKKVPNRSIESIDELVEFTQNTDVVIKPRFGSSGKGIHFLSFENNELRFDDKPISKNELSKTFSSLQESIIVEYINQDNYASKIYPDSVNTIRVLTMVDPDTGEVFVPAAFHRFGSSDSGKVDNISSGGVTVDVDIESGVLGTGYTSPKKSKPQKHSSHPDTGETFEGIEIPHWDSVISDLKEIVENHRGLWPYVGWDLIIKDNHGDFCLLEGNPATGIDTFQIHEPLLKNERVKRFYKHHNIV